jgi:hypothetical protein
MHIDKEYIICSNIMSHTTKKINILTVLMDKKDKEEVKQQKNIKKTEMKNVGGRPKKSIKYKKEREDVMKKLNGILGITEENKMFYVCDIDDDKQKKISDMKDEIGEYFGGKHTLVFAGETDMKREFLSLIKTVYKEMGFTIIRKIKTVVRNDIKQRSTCYYIWDKTLPSF